MSENNQNSLDQISFYISVTSTLLLTISEILPYIKSVKSNGVLQIILNISKDFLSKLQNQNSNINEHQPLLSNISEHQPNINEHQQNMGEHPPNISELYIEDSKEQMVTLNKFEQEIERLETLINKNNQSDSSKTQDNHEVINTPVINTPTPIQNDDKKHLFIVNKTNGEESDNESIKSFGSFTKITIIVE